MPGVGGRLFVVFIRGYQRVISPWLPGRCRFYPSCSEYAVQCFTHYGVPRALLKSTYRILRCNPFSEGYFDPAVPEAIGQELSTSPNSPRTETENENSKPA